MVVKLFLYLVKIRTYEQEEVEKLAEDSSIPIINGLTDFAQTCQVLADLMMIREYKGNLEGKKLCYIGDDNNMANSLIVGCLKVGMKISVACPKGYEPDLKVIDFAKDIPNFLLTEDIYEVSKNDCIVLHCLPAHREEEITT